MTFYSTFLVVGLSAIVATLISLRREHIRTEYSVSWLGVGLVLSGVALFPHSLESAARKVGVDPYTCFVTFGGVLVSVVVFEISHLVSRLRDDNVVLAQRIAILEYQVQQTRAEREGADSAR